MMSVKGRCAIAGLGVTPMGKIYGRSATDFALEAIELALQDAGLQKDEVDGLLINAALDHLEPIDESVDPCVLAPGEHPLGQAVLKREEPEVPEAGTLRSERGELVERFVGQRRFDQDQPAG